MTSPGEDVPYARLFWPRVLLLVLALLFYLANAGKTEGRYNDFITHWTLARLAVTGHRAASYDYDVQAALLRSELPADKLGWLDSKHIAGIGVSPYPPVMVVLYAPLGLLNPAAAALVLNVASIVLALVTAL